MKKDEPQVDMRPEYQRSDFTKLERGKYAARVAESSAAIPSQ